jgi:hypothetical protein
MFRPVLDRSEKADQDLLTAGLASLSAEVQLYSVRLAQEDLRQQWADTLGTMLRTPPDPKK